MLGIDESLWRSNTIFSALPTHTEECNAPKLVDWFETFLYIQQAEILDVAKERHPSC